MGYETRLFIVNRDDVMDECLAMLNMCKVDGELLNVFKEEYTKKDFISEKETHFFYIGSGFEAMQADLYGKPLRVAPMNKVLEVMKKLEAIEHYRRYSMAIGIMESLNPKDYDELLVVSYGY